MYIDTHCHLNYPELYEDRKSIIERAYTVGVNQIITIGTDIESSEICIKIAEEFDSVYVAVGIHPTDLQSAKESWQQELIQLAKHPKVKAIGEIGLDYYWNTTKPEDQHRFLSEQIEIAKDLNLPLVIHNRRADEDIKTILMKHNYFNGVLHCYSSDEHFAQEMLDLGLHISFTGNITYGSKKLQRALKIVPTNRLMLETDAPYITPVPHKGQTNEPAYIPLIAEKIAEIKNLPLSDIASGTTQTAIKFFNLNS